LLALIAIEFILILFFSVRIMDLLKPPAQPGVAIPVHDSLWKRIQAKWAASNFVPIEQEASIDLQHDYDGIRELDNVIPPWFTAAFAITILFAGVYLYRYHIAKSAPLQLEELSMAMAKADLEHEAYLASQASSIDENNVTLMTGADLEAGQQVFTTLCAVCHKTDGGGLVGPNMTDDYWIHGGSLKDIFKTIKYGVPDKGMISWKTQLSPLQIAQVANYIKTLRGTNPPDAKEKQGELYVESATPPDSTATQPIPPDTTSAIK
jgi:cytochrome c oxidase cbb3-type subunit 3